MFKNGIFQIIISYLVLWFPILISKFTGEISKDIFLICIFLSALVMVDAKMKYNTKLVKLNFWIMIFLVIVMLNFHIF
ncbi:MAG: hypothetical protein J6J60_05190 [Clostridia bacterium]|nr:hypothetical protein [Clostridia bacterium]